MLLHGLLLHGWKQIQYIVMYFQASSLIQYILFTQVSDTGSITNCGTVYFIQISVAEDHFLK